MSTKFFTNEPTNTLFDKFKGVFENMPNIKYFDVLVGYLRASGYFKIRDLFQDDMKVRILVGIDVDNIMNNYHSKGLEFRPTSAEINTEYLRKMKNEIQQSTYLKQNETSILQFIEDVANERVIIKAHPNKKLHAKLYIFKPENFNEHSAGMVITGSSNLSAQGIGTNKASNYEFNVLLKDYDDIKFASDEFEKLWSESVDILPETIITVKEGTFLHEVTPFQLYIKLLIEYFGDRIEYDTQMEKLLPKDFISLQYQNDAAVAGYKLMMEHNGFFLADVVGLGKTIVACLIAKKFILEHQLNGYKAKVLVVHPPAIESEWKETVDAFDILNDVEFISTGKLERILDTNNRDFKNPDIFDLVIIDESHKFRNQNSNMYNDLQMICKSERRNIGIDGDKTKKIMLLSATPMNNSPADIENQLYLFQDKRFSTLSKEPDLQKFFKGIKDEYKSISVALKGTEDKNIIEKTRLLAELGTLFEKVRKNVIEDLVIRRTRTDIEKDKNYAKDLKKRGIKFPKILPPNEVKYEFDTKLAKLFKKTVGVLTGTKITKKEVPINIKQKSVIKNGKFKIKLTEFQLKYYRYRAIEFLKSPEDQELYGGSQVESIAKRLEAIMKTLLIKRLESSFHAFKESLGRMLKATENMIEMFEQDKVFIAPDLNINELMNDDKLNFDSIESIIKEKGASNRIFKKDAFEDGFIDQLKIEKELISYLVAEWDKINYDPKLNQFLKDIEEEFFKDKINVNGKLVVFSESKETVQYLKDNLEDSGRKDVLAIDSGSRDKKKKVIQENFDANFGEKNFKNDYNIIISTEVLAEGVNLHRSNVVVNYDVPWNSTRLMQRIGRVNRIGTKADYINIYNYYPSSDSEDKIKLSATAIRKLQAFHTAFGEDSQIYSRLEEVSEAGLYGKDTKEDTDPINDLLTEIRTFKQENEEEFAEIKKLSNKSRAMRSADQVKALGQDIKNCTITYIKSKNHPGTIYSINADNQPVELSIMEAAKILKAEKTEQGFKNFPDFHYDHVQKATEMFYQKQLPDDTLTSTTVVLNPNEKKALNNIKSLIRTSKLAEEKKNILKKTKEYIEKGRIKKLSKDLVKYFNTNTLKITEEYVDGLIDQILSKYITNEEPTYSKTKRTIEMPRIILSETIIKKS